MSGSTTTFTPHESDPTADKSVASTLTSSFAFAPPLEDDDQDDTFLTTTSTSPSIAPKTAPRRSSIAGSFVISPPPRTPRVFALDVRPLAPLIAFDSRPLVPLTLAKGEINKELQAPPRSSATIGRHDSAFGYQQQTSELLTLRSERRPHTHDSSMRSFGSREEEDRLRNSTVIGDEATMMRVPLSSSVGPRPQPPPRAPVSTTTFSGYERTLTALRADSVHTAPATKRRHPMLPRVSATSRSSHVGVGPASRRALTAPHSPRTAMVAQRSPATHRAATSSYYSTPLGLNIDIVDSNASRHVSAPVGTQFYPSYQTKQGKQTDGVNKQKWFFIRS